MKMQKTVGYDPTTRKMIRKDITLEEYRECTEYHYREDFEWWEKWLDEVYQAYSCGLSEHPDDDLVTMQRNKYEYFAKEMGARPGMVVVEEGGGFGGMSRFLASEYGCEVHVFNISKAQHAHCIEQSMVNTHYYRACHTEVPTMIEELGIKPDAWCSDEFIVHVGMDRTPYFEARRPLVDEGVPYVMKLFSASHDAYDCTGRLMQKNLEVFGGVGEYPSYHHSMKCANDGGWARANSKNIPPSDYLKTAEFWLSPFIKNYDWMYEKNPTLTKQTHAMLKLYPVIFRQWPTVLNIEITTLVACDPDKYNG